MSGSNCSSKPLSTLLDLFEQGANGPLVTRLDTSHLRGLTITGVTNDSRKVQPGNIFFCIQGEHQNGNDFAEDAAGKGAICVFSEDANLSCSAPIVPVADVRLALALAAGYFYENPSRKMRLLGVTGTNGKTTTTHLVETILTRAGHRVGLIGTLGARWQQADGTTQTADYGQTTPQAPELQKTLYQMAASSVSHVTMEVSSHSLAVKHVASCDFASATLTNITQDHLDFHKSMERYWHAKLVLFQLLSQSTATNKHAIVNLDEPLSKEFLKVLSKDVKPQTYSWRDKADVRVVNATFDFSGCRLELETPQGPCRLNLKLNGPFNVYNVMAALLICLSEGIDLRTCKAALEDFSGVPGRFQVVASAGEGRAQEPLCIVDYAHTPDGLTNILKAARALVPNDGKLIVVFGCGGDRDTSKRPQMGEIAERLANEVIVTSDNPRTEDPKKIISEILAGITRLSAVRVEQDRDQAISLAISNASPKDVVVIAGKGHENYQILGNKTIAFDDRSHVKNALEQIRSRS